MGNAQAPRWQYTVRFLVFGVSRQARGKQRVKRALDPRAKCPIICNAAGRGDGVNVVSKKKLREFWSDHPEAEDALTWWYNIFRKSSPQHFADLRTTFGSVDFVNPFTIFDVGGNKYRVIALIDYQEQFSKIVAVFTHAEYDDWNKSK
jgi:mRNA interferase HigB